VNLCGKTALVTGAAKRIGSPQDVVVAALFLLEGGDFITGQVLLVDGGRSLAGG
jgi:NAD(P)-dependent dehydrogenase (short-subunit alcohol dehydrogenase family)